MDVGKAMATTNGFKTATSSYLAWLASQVPLVERDLVRKRKEMRKSPFAFLRATYYLWAQTWPEECPELADAPTVAAVGDLHVENFGTWRDAEGRLAWGVNDLDEASCLPYTSDLVRLATSAFLARDDDRVSLSKDDICSALRRGYATTIREGARAVVLAESNRRLGERIVERLVKPKTFWSKKLGEDLRRRECPGPARGLLADALPAGAKGVEIHGRVAGLGSLGRMRFVAIAEWDGGRIAREAKALAPSAALWAAGVRPRRGARPVAARLLTATTRSHDPYLAISRGWVVRRLAPDSDKTKLSSLGSPDLEESLLELMGAETANVHLATDGAAGRIAQHLEHLDAARLREAAERMARRIERDFEGQ